MTALAQISRATRYSPRTFTAFRATQHQGKWRTDPIAIDSASTLEEAIAAAITRFLHKETLVIRETEDGAGVTLHVFVIRKKAPRYIRGEFGIGSRRVEDLYADKIAELDGHVLAGLAIDGAPATPCEFCGVLA